MDLNPSGGDADASLVDDVFSDASPRTHHTTPPRSTQSNGYIIPPLHVEQHQLRNITSPYTLKERTWQEMMPEAAISPRSIRKPKLTRAQKLGRAIALALKAATTGISKSSLQHVSIQGTHIDGKNVSYDILIQAPNNLRWVVTRRFSDFARLHATLQKLNLRNVPPFPSREWGTMLVDQNYSAEFLNERRALLNTWLRRILLFPKLRSSAPFLDFLRPTEDDLTDEDRLASQAELLEEFYRNLNSKKTAAATTPNGSHTKSLRFVDDADDDGANTPATNINVSVFEPSDQQIDEMLTATQGDQTTSAALEAEYLELLQIYIVSAKLLPKHSELTSSAVTRLRSLIPSVSVAFRTIKIAELHQRTRLKKLKASTAMGGGSPQRANKQSDSECLSSNGSTDVPTESLFDSEEMLLKAVEKIRQTELDQLHDLLLNHIKMVLTEPTTSYGAYYAKYHLLEQRRPISELKLNMSEVEAMWLVGYGCYHCIHQFFLPSVLARVVPLHFRTSRPNSSPPPQQVPPAESLINIKELTRQLHRYLQHQNARVEFVTKMIEIMDILPAASSLSHALNYVLPTPHGSQESSSAADEPWMYADMPHAPHHGHAPILDCEQEAPRASAHTLHSLARLDARIRAESLKRGDQTPPYTDSNEDGPPVFETLSGLFQYLLNQTDARPAFSTESQLLPALHAIYEPTHFRASPLKLRSNGSQGAVIGMNSTGGSISPSRAHTRRSSVDSSVGSSGKYPSPLPTPSPRQESPTKEVAAKMEPSPITTN